MVDVTSFRKMALAFPGTEELPHFHLTSFRLNNKIFATLNVQEEKAMLRLTPTDQSVFCSADNKVIFPVPGAWGRQGSTFFYLKNVRKDIFKDALTLAYEGLKSKNKPTKKKK